MAKDTALAKLNRDIKSLGTKTKKWRDDVQLILIRCAAYAFQGNAEPMTSVVAQLEGADVAAVIKWAEMYAPVLWRASDDGIKRFGINKSFEGEFDAAYLMGTAWWVSAKKPQQVSSIYDVADAVRDLIKRAEREVTAGKKTVHHADLIRDLKALAGRASQAEAAE